MPRQSFDVGNHVRVSAASLSGPATKGEFRIEERYAVEGREPLYRLSSIEGATERMVPESELQPARLHLPRR